MHDRQFVRTLLLSLVAPLMVVLTVGMTVKGGKKPSSTTVYRAALIPSPDEASYGLSCGDPQLLGAGIDANPCQGSPCQLTTRARIKEIPDGNIGFFVTFYRDPDDPTGEGLLFDGVQVCDGTILVGMQVRLSRTSKKLDRPDQFSASMWPLGKPRNFTVEAELPNPPPSLDDPELVYDKTNCVEPLLTGDEDPGCACIDILQVLSIEEQSKRGGAGATFREVYIHQLCVQKVE